MAILVPLFLPYDPYGLSLEQVHLSPSWSHPFGTDELGRDLLVRTCCGIRVSLLIGLTAAAIDLFIGICIGGIAALMGGRTDTLIMRLVDGISSIPYLLVVILLTSIIGSGLPALLLALTLTGWISMARMVRGRFMQLRLAPFVQASALLGAPRSHILFRHLLPNGLAAIGVTLSFTIPNAIFVEAFLSFLGLGVQPPLASLGTLASQGLSALGAYPWKLLCPSVALSLLILAFLSIGEGLRNRLDPTLREVAAL